MDLDSFDSARCKEALSSYDAVIRVLGKPNLVSLDDFYRRELPELLRQRNPNPHITAGELSRLMEWKLARGKWRPRLLSFMSALDDAVVREASTKAFASLPDVSKAVQELTVLKGVGPATASAVLAAYAPEVVPFMSDEALIVVTGDTKDYSLKRYVAFAEKMQTKAKMDMAEVTLCPGEEEIRAEEEVMRNGDQWGGGRGRGEHLGSQRKRRQN
ncbi:DNA binding [Striga hermonthica]|uniref:DNA binding n=1 Tax=Striga hermonthica TaxID=68872 RepID=A0A9N7NYC4_STRHE|nr:DNA binding [Striga hermonthica]